MIIRKLQMESQKAKVKWLKDGDQNSKFFHSLLKSRSNKATIDKIELEDGSLTSDELKIENEIIGYYNKLYKKSGGDGSGLDGVEWRPVTLMKAEQLERPFSEEEIRGAVLECDGAKAPGPDGFTLAFYQKSWDTIKDDLLKVFGEFYDDGIVNGKTNETYICLIPKKKDATKIKDFRPISLITNLYKILAKVLTNRLKKVMSKTVAENQCAFIRGRQITDCCLIANEVVEEYRRKKKKGWILKVDLEKTYDNVDWRFLDFVLLKKGFGVKWRKWIRGCVSNVSYSIFINHRPRGKVQGGKGSQTRRSIIPFSVSDKGSQTRNSTFRSPWKFISRSHSSCQHLIGTALRGGNLLRFWEDSWVGGLSFKDRFPHLFLLSSSSNKPIDQFYSVSNSQGITSVQWDVRFRRGLNDVELGEYTSLLSILESASLSVGSVDVRVWLGEPSGVFSVSSLFYSFFPSLANLSFPYFTNIWKVPIPQKVKAFSWIVALGRLQTCDSLQKRQPSTVLRPQWCSLCKLSEENQDHLLLHCSFTRRIWIKVMQHLGFEWIFPAASRDMFVVENGFLNQRGRRIFCVPVFQHLLLSDLVRDWCFIYL
ncbi:uncharacterized protein LOC142534974 [Primulina tabacum]|uniref:uncharacterized protein LOC142534974 n=1 Tax=Primulina tabacum TaxID=48773 RepID=UPI003F59D14C